MTFMERLIHNVQEVGPLCAGLDPHPSLLHAWDLPYNADGLREYVQRCVEAFIPAVGIVKPQVGLFEPFGAAGYHVLETAIASLREAGVCVIADVKRSDIGSTMAGYVTAWTDAAVSPLASDAFTVNPFMGPDSLTEVIAAARSNDAGVFLLARTSNPQSDTIQLASAADGVTVSQNIVNYAVAQSGLYGDVGLVIGATRGHGLDLREFSGPILIPGIGAQGATAEDVKEIFALELTKNSSEDGNPRQKVLIPTMARALLSSGPSVQAMVSTILGFNSQFRFLQQ